MTDPNASQERWLTACVVLASLTYIAATLPQLSMALDGVVYASIAKQIAAGVGSFWQPPQFHHPELAFHEHPPLGLWLQGSFFTVFGDAFWVERLWCVLLMLTIVALILAFWRVTHPDKFVHGSWLAVFVFLALPITNRVLRNNVLELPLTVATLSAVICAWLSRRHWAYAVLTGLLCAGAFLVKGPVGLFALIAPLIVHTTLDSAWWRGVSHSALATVVCCAVLGLSLLADEAAGAMAKYWQQQVWASIQGLRYESHGRGYLLAQLIEQLAIIVVLAAMAGYWRRSFAWRRECTALVLVGLAASLPLLISPRQFRHYLFPSLPYFALAAAYWVSPENSKAHRPGLPRWAYSALALVLSLALVWRVAVNFGVPGRDAVRLAELERLSERAHSNPVGFCEYQPIDQAYLMRYFDTPTVVGVPGRSPSHTGIEVWVCESSTYAGSPYSP